MKKLLKKLHLYCALILCLPLIIQGFSGSIMAFRNEIATAILNHKHQFAAGEFASEDAIIRMAQTQASQDLVVMPIKMPEKQNSAVKVRFNKEGEKKPVLEVVLDPVSLEIIEVNDPKQNFFRLVKKFHEDLFIEGNLGKNIVGIYGIALLFMSLSGLVLWWPKSAFFKRAITFKFTDKGKKFHRDFHSALGFWFMIPMLAVSITGIYLIYFKSKESSKLWHSVHDGSFAGIYGETIIFLVGFLPLAFAITGIILWYQKRKIKQKSQNLL